MQCLEKEVSRRPSAKRVYDTMQGMLQGEGGLPNEPVRVVNTDPTWGSSGTDSTYDSVGSRVSSAGGYGSASSGYGIANGNGFANGNEGAVSNATVANGNGAVAAPIAASTTADAAAPASGVRISRGNLGKVGTRA